jgi:hypothetical protein
MVGRYIARASAMNSQQIQEALAKNGKVYISVTGLTPNGFISWLKFWRYAIPSKMQADNAPGALFVDVKTVDAYHHTLTVWENKKAMLAFMTSGAHKNAMKNFKSIATGRVYGFEAEVVPSWEAALAKLWEHGRTVG